MIEKVTGSRGVHAARRGGGVRPRSGFHIADGTDTAPHAAAEVGAVPLTQILALQEEEADAVQDRAARRHGEEMLAELASVQRDLLQAGLGRKRLGHLLDLATAPPRASDERLRDVVAAVALRVKVELARYDVAPVTLFE